MTKQPTQLGRYQIETHLGAGAHADVYRAVDPLLKRTVALKVLKPALMAEEDAFARFTREAQVLAGLVHPRIAWVWDMGEAKGRYFIAVRYVEGKSLDKVIAERGSLPWKEALQIVEQVADGLQFAHEKGLVHRDVKPQNIIISETEGAVLTDFGLVRAIASSGMTTTGAMLGTPHYMAPEVWEAEDAGPAADQYALACILAEILTGKVLFAGTNPPAVMAKHFKPPEFPHLLGEGVPKVLTSVLRKALARNPADRYRSISDFMAALKGLVVVQPAKVQTEAVLPPSKPASKPPDLVKPLPDHKPSRRRTFSFGVILLGTVLLGSLVFIGLSYLIKPLSSTAFTTPFPSPSPIALPEETQIEVTATEDTYLPNKCRLLSQLETFSDWQKILDVITSMESEGRGLDLECNERSLAQIKANAYYGLAVQLYFQKQYSSAKDNLTQANSLDPSIQVEPLLSCTDAWLGGNPPEELKKIVSMYGDTSVEQTCGFEFKPEELVSLDILWKLSDTRLFYTTWDIHHFNLGADPNNALITKGVVPLNDGSIGKYWGERVRGGNMEFSMVSNRSLAPGSQVGWLISGQDNQELYFVLRIGENNVTNAEVKYTEGGSSFACQVISRQYNLLETDGNFQPHTLSFEWDSSTSRIMFKVDNDLVCQTAIEWISSPKVSLYLSRLDPSQTAHIAVSGLTITLTNP